jgi:hypothetical protein
LTIQIHFVCFSTAAAYYTEAKKQENAVNPKPWKSLTTDERKPYFQTLYDVKHF